MNRDSPASQILAEYGARRRPRGCRLGPTMRWTPPPNDGTERTALRAAADPRTARRPK